MANDGKPAKSQRICQIDRILRKRNARTNSWGLLGQKSRRS
jgi:hypothetical protein